MHRGRLLWTIAAALALAAPCAAPAFAAGRGVTLLAASASAVRFAVDVPAPRLRPVAGDGGFVAPDIEGFALDAPAGGPALPVRTIQVAVPPAGEVRVAALAFDPEVTENVTVAPLDGSAAAPARAGAASTRAAAPRARLAGVTWMRNQRVAIVAVSPAEFDAAARRLTVYRRIEVEVQLPLAARALDAREAEPVDAFEQVYRDGLVNYEQGRAWRRTLPSTLRAPGGALRGAATGPAANGAVFPPDTSVYAGRTWIKMTVTKTGFYKVNFGQLRNLALFGGNTNVALDSLRLFTWPGVPVLPEKSYCDTCDYREVALRVNDDGDGKFGSNSDEIEFFAMGPSDWADLYREPGDPLAPDSLFINNPYDTKNYYYLTVADAGAPVGGTPRRYAIASAAVDSSGAEVQPATFAMRQHLEQDIEYFPDLSPKSYPQYTLPPWEKFWWKSLDPGKQLVVNAVTPGIDTATPARVRIHMWAISRVDDCGSDTFHRFSVTAAGLTLPDSIFSTEPHMVDATFPLVAGTNPIVIAGNYDPACPPRVDRVAIGWVDLRYPRRFEPVANELTFDSENAAGDYLYHVGPFTSATVPRVFDVTDAYAPVELTSFRYTTGDNATWTLAFEASQTGLRRFRIVPPASVAALPDANLGDAAFTSLQNLRSRVRSADYLVIYFDAFDAAAEALRLHRESVLPLAGKSAPYEAAKIPVSAVFDQFSGGRSDPMAIRNFLHAVFYNWRDGTSPPSFVTLLGDASFDFKNVLGRAQPGQPGAPVPSYQNGFSLDRAFATDDVLLNVNDPVLVVPDFFGGRIPVSSLAAAQDYVRKLKVYELNAPLGAYRDRVMLIADDNEQGGSADGLSWRHLGQTTDLDTTRIPRQVDRAYVFLHKYPDGPGDTKPAAKAEIKKFVNEGVALFNYIGHGSPFQLADEKVLLDTDAGTFENANRLTVFVSASCDVGKFDDPVVPSLGERLLLASNGGAIAVISATEIALSDYNVDLAKGFYDALFDRDPAGHYHAGVSEALLSSKLGLASGGILGENNQKYQVMGDAGVGMNLPRKWADVTIHACDTCSTPVTTIQTGKLYTYRGRLLEGPGGAPLAFNGVADLLLEDSAPYEKVPPCALSSFCDTSVRYFYRPGPIFRGDVRVTNGTFSGQFIVPIEARGGAYGKVRAYVQGRVAGETADTDGAGGGRLQVSPGAPDGSDNSGPNITLSFGGGSTAVKPDASLRVDLFDPSGILITDHNPQNGIIVTVDGNTTSRVDITSTFRYLAGSYQSGTATFKLPNLALGEHTIQVCAADNYAAGLSAGAHRSCATLSFTVAETPPLTLVSTYLFPNPATSRGAGRGGVFVVEARGDSLNALLRIYTQAGKLVRVLKTFGGLGQVQMAWDGLDDEGDPLANGTYFYRVQINAREEDGRSSAVQKAAAEGRFVILN